MDDKSASIREYILRAPVHIALARELVKKASWESCQKQMRLEIQGVLPADLLEADGHQTLGAWSEHVLSAQIHS